MVFGKAILCSLFSMKKQEIPGRRFLQGYLMFVLTCQPADSYTMRLHYLRKKGLVGESLKVFLENAD
jgi:hypothetical protein